MARTGVEAPGAKRFRYVDARDVVDHGRGAARADRRARHSARLDGVWISPSPRARLQATGVDAAGRKQYRYHDELPRGAGAGEVRAPARLRARAAPPSGRTTASSARSVRARVDLRARRRRHQQGVVPGRLGAARAQLADLRRHHAPEAARLRGRRRDRVSLPREEPQARAADDRERAARRGVEELLALPDGSRLFRFERDGELSNLTSAMLNDYIGEQPRRRTTRRRTSGRGAGRCSRPRSSSAAVPPRPMPRRSGRSLQ